MSYERINRSTRSTGELGGERLPLSPLSDAMSGGAAQSSRTGNDVVAGPAPAAEFQTVNGFAYLKDLRPNLAAQRSVYLSADPVYSASCSLVTSYNAVQNPENTMLLDAADASFVSSPLRDFRWWIEFGVASTKHSMEVDVSEGVVATLPCATINVTLYSTHYTRKLKTQIMELESMAHLSTGGVPRASYVTDRVYCPFQVSVDPLNPPTIEQQLADLKAAVCVGAIGAVAP